MGSIMMFLHPLSAQVIDPVDSRAATCEAPTHRLREQLVKRTVRPDFLVKNSPRIQAGEGVNG
jgi:hypothetical protein